MNKYLEKIAEQLSLTKNIHKSLMPAVRKDAFIGDLDNWKAKRSMAQTILIDGKPVGTINLVDSPDGIIVESLFIAEQYRGKGYAAKAINMFTKGKSSLAYIEPTNIKSLGLFKSLGYKKTDTYRDNKLGITYDVLTRAR